MEAASKLPAAEKKGKMKGKGGSKGKEQEKIDPPAGPMKNQPEKPQMRSRKEMDEVCPYYQCGKCRYSIQLECGKKHHLLKRHEIQFLAEEKGKKKGKG